MFYRFGEVLVRFWSLRGHKTFKMLKNGVVAGRSRDLMMAAKRRHHHRLASQDEADRGELRRIHALDRRRSSREEMGRVCVSSK